MFASRRALTNLPFFYLPAIDGGPTGARPAFFQNTSQNDLQIIEMRFGLTNAGPAALNENDQHDYEENPRNDPNQSCIIHVYSPFLSYLKYFSNDSDKVIRAGPRATTNNEGKMNKTSGKTIFTGVFAAISSTCCRR